MHDKVLLSVKLPATGGLYEFRVPFDLTVDQAARLISQVLGRREPSRYDSSGAVDLMLLDEGGAGGQLNPNETVRALVEQGTLADGSHVALV